MSRVVPAPLTTLFIIGIAISLTVGSLNYIHPSECNRLCVKEPCLAYECKFGEQGAGFPIPIVRDAEIGSPTLGWGKLGPEDYMYVNFIAFFIDILFYSAPLFFIWKVFVKWRATTK